jgi:hypothetical protein
MPLNYRKNQEIQEIFFQIKFISKDKTYFSFEN